MFINLLCVVWLLILSIVVLTDDKQNNDPVMTVRHVENQVLTDDIIGEDGQEYSRIVDTLGMYNLYYYDSEKKHMVLFIEGITGKKK